MGGIRKFSKNELNFDLKKDPVTITEVSFSDSDRKMVRREVCAFLVCRLSNKEGKSMAPHVLRKCISVIFSVSVSV